MLAVIASQNPTDTRNLKKTARRLSDKTELVWTRIKLRHNY